ncbi:MAG: SDR family NAD(P)-dependent oxidoreductase [Alphaproteobacteria bacterium]
MPTEFPSAAAPVWITGASSGIGRALALGLARQGRLVVGSARDGAALSALASAARGLPGRILPLALDVTDPGAMPAALAKIEAEHGPLAQAVLNAGTHIPMGAADFKSATLRKLIAVNLMGAAHGLEAILPGMLARRAGRIAVVSSVAGYRGLPSAAAYSASKAAVIAMCEALRPECARNGVTLQLINPGFVETPLTAKNDFPMPMMISAEKAADYILRGLASDRFEIAFPRRFALIMKLLRIMPYPLFFAATKKLLR